MRRSEQRREIGAYVRDRIRKECPERGDVARLARRLDFAPSTLSNVLQGRTNIGEDLLAALFQHWGVAEHDVDMLALEHEAIAVGGETDPFPNRRIAAKIARDGGLRSDAIDAVLAERFDFIRDPPVLWWIRRMDVRASLMVMDEPAQKEHAG